MLIKNPGENGKGDNIPSSQITPPETYFSRRNFLRSAALVGGVAATAGVYRLLTNPRFDIMSPFASLAEIFRRPSDLKFDPPALYAGPETNLSPAERLAKGYDVDKTVDPLTSFREITTYNNYYEFGTTKEQPAIYAPGFETDPWTLTVDGLCNKPRTFDLDNLKKVAPLEKRTYRHRCVEGWSMVIPWLGFPLAALLSKVDPKSDAKFVAFQTFFDAAKMPYAGYLPFPYHEGLRIDEAMNPLALLAMGLYEKVLLPQNGAPIRLVVPWKYGFKNVKAIVRITLVKDQPRTSWNDDQPFRYGFYSNVNPNFSPRDNQVTEYRRDEGWRDTLPFNGYATQVAHMYKDMDLTKYY